MSNQNLATIEVIKDIKPHPDLEVTKIEIAQVLGFWCVVQKGQYNIGGKVILIQPDSVLPKDQKWAQVYGNIKRVKSKKIRGFISFGIIESIENLFPTAQGFHDFTVGEDVTEQLGITKFEVLDKQLNAKRPLPYAIPRTSETHWQNIRDIQGIFGCNVDVTLKIDGSSCSFYYKDGEFGVLSRSLELKTDVNNKYTIHIQKLNLEEKLTEYCKKYKVNLCLRGEIYGKGIQNIQNNPHSKKDLSIAFYSTYLIDECKYTGINDTHYFINVCEELNLPTVPVLEFGQKLTNDLIEKYMNISKINGEFYEGVVIKGSDFSFKVINLEYDTWK